MTEAIERLDTERTDDPRRAQLREAVGRLRTRARAADPVVFFTRVGSVALVLGFGAMYLGWYGASHSVREVEQLPYLISGGLVGLGLVIVGGLLLATVLWARLVARLLEAGDSGAAAARVPLARASGPASVAVTTPTRPPAADQHPSGAVATRGGRLYHRPECRMVAGRDVIDAARSRADSPCQICEPELRASR